MFSDRVFQIAFLISLLTHGVILFQNSNLNLFSTNKKEENLEVSYIKELQKTQDSKTVVSKREPFLKIQSKINMEKRTPPPFVEKENIFKITDKGTLLGPKPSKPILMKPDIIAIKKKITLPQIGLDKISNASYISYYQIVREKIRRAAYLNYTRTDTGEVYISFIISCDGYLKEIRLVEEKSPSSPYLREIALKSIKDASPFPNFPKGLDYPQLSFNVIISFEVE